MLPCHSCYMKRGRGFKVIIGKAERGWRHKGKGVIFEGELTPQLFYQHCLPISASFGIKRVLRYTIPSC